METKELGRQAVLLAEESGRKLGRWLELFERRLAEAEATEALCDLKEFVAFTTALKRVLEIARIAETLSPEEKDEGGAPLDTDALRALLSEED